MTDIPLHWFGSNPSWFLKRIPTSSIYKKAFAKPGLLDRIQPFHRNEYEGYLRATDEAF